MKQRLSTLPQYGRGHMQSPQIKNSGNSYQQGNPLLIAEQRYKLTQEKPSKHPMTLSSFQTDPYGIQTLQATYPAPAKLVSSRFKSLVKKNIAEEVTQRLEKIFNAGSKKEQLLEAQFQLEDLWQKATGTGNVEGANFIESQIKEIEDQLQQISIRHIPNVGLPGGAGFPGPAVPAGVVGGAEILKIGIQIVSKVNPVVAVATGVVIGGLFVADSLLDEDENKEPSEPKPDNFTKIQKYIDELKEREELKKQKKKEGKDVLDKIKELVEELKKYGLDPLSQTSKIAEEIMFGNPNALELLTMFYEAKNLIDDTLTKIIEFLTENAVRAFQIIKLVLKLIKEMGSSVYDSLVSKFGGVSRVNFTELIKSIQELGKTISKWSLD